MFIQLSVLLFIVLGLGASQNAFAQMPGVDRPLVPESSESAQSEPASSEPEKPKIKKVDVGVTAFGTKDNNGYSDIGAKAEVKYSTLPTGSNESGTRASIGAGSTFSVGESPMGPLVGSSPARIVGNAGFSYYPIPYFGIGADVSKTPYLSHATAPSLHGRLPWKSGEADLTVAPGTLFQHPDAKFGAVGLGTMVGLTAEQNITDNFRIGGRLLYGAAFSESKESQSVKRYVAGSLYGEYRFGNKAYLRGETITESVDSEKIAPGSTTYTQSGQVGHTVGLTLGIPVY